MLFFTFTFSRLKHLGCSINIEPNAQHHQALTSEPFRHKTHSDGHYGGTNQHMRASKPKAGVPIDISKQEPAHPPAAVKLAFADPAHLSKAPRP